MKKEDCTGQEIKGSESLLLEEDFHDRIIFFLMSVV